MTTVGNATRAVAANVAAHRNARGWSLRTLSGHLHETGIALAPDALNKIEAALRGDGDNARRVTVDELVALAGLFGVDPASMLTAPDCDTCNGAPPTGFTCQNCGKEAQ